MSEDEVQELIQSLSEDFSSDDLANEAEMLRSLRDLLDLRRPVLKEILGGLRELKNLRGDRKPDWAVMLLRH